MMTNAATFLEHDRAVLERLGAELPRPAGVLNLELEDRQDFLGEPGSFLNVYIDPKVFGLGAERLARIMHVRDYGRRLKKKLLQAGALTWPTVRLRYSNSL